MVTPAPVRALDRVRERWREVASIAAPLKGPRAYANWALTNVERALRTSRVRARPLKLTLDPTNICQLRCPLCPTGLRIQDRAPGRGRLDVFEHLIEEVGDYVFFIDFYNWGEPLLNKQLEEMIGLAARRNIVTFVSSNLSLPLTDARIESLVRSGLCELIVSLDGATQATYATYRREGDLELALSNMKRIIETKQRLGLTRPVVVWRYYVYRWNEHEIDLARRRAAEIGVDRLVFATPYLDEGRFPIPPVDREAMKSWASTLPAFNRYQPGHPEWQDPAKPIAKRSRCDWHYVSTAINPDGSVAPCCAVFEQANDFGRLEPGTTGYMDVINNERFVAIRDRFAGRRSEPTGLVCEQCPTPAIMDYATIMNRHVAMFTLVSLVESLKRWLRFGRRPVMATPATHAAPAGPAVQGTLAAPVPPAAAPVAGTPAASAPPAVPAVSSERTPLSPTGSEP